MLSLDVKNSVFNLTLTKLQYWHRHSGHLPFRDGCPFCSEDMFVVASYLSSHGFKVIKSGRLFVTIASGVCVNNWKSVESDRLFRLVSRGVLN